MARWAARAAGAAALTAVAHACVPLGGVDMTIGERHHAHHGEALGAAAAGQPLSAIEKMALDAAEVHTARKNLRHYASLPHMAGTAGDHEMALFTQNKMKEFGLEDSVIHEMDALLTYPVSRSLELVSREGKTLFQAPLIEAELEMDPTSNTEWRNMSFLAYGPTGAVSAPVVYANYGRPADFDALKAAGVDVAGKVALVRYGECFRGLKAMNAQERGAVATIIYSDPGDDGYAVGETYPQGSWRPADSIQRGSAQFISLCAGDPGRADTKEVCGYENEELIPKIPILPISYGDALPLLKAMRGPLAPKPFVGGLADQLEYHLGPSESEVRLVVNNTFVRTPIWNVITTIPGEEDTPIVLGNHRDAWVFGAADPNSGSTVMLEVAKAFGKLVQSGWRPKRTIIFGSWSGEEYGLIGSTGWGEEFARTTLKDAIAYLNVDVGVSGTQLMAAASPTLSRAVLRATTKVQDPLSDKPLSESWSRKVGTLGSGSDYTVFLDHLGIPSVDLSFAPGNNHTYGVYHSIYDSFTWIETQVDPEYKVHVALAQVVTVLALDLADSERLPLDVVDLGDALSRYHDQLAPLLASIGVTSDGLGHAIQRFQKEADSFFHAAEALPALCANAVLAKFERVFLDPIGLPRRKWFKHILQAPGFYLGYAAEVFPGIQQAITEKNRPLALQEIQRAADIVQAASSELAKVAACSGEEQMAVA